MGLTEEDIIKAHEFCFENRKMLEVPQKCGCFSCLKIFDSREITEWILDGDETAVCPYCEIDSVIGESSGYPITEEFLRKMYDHWMVYDG